MKIIAVGDGVSPTGIADVLPTPIDMIDGSSEETAVKARGMLTCVVQGLRDIGLSVSG